MNPNCHLDIGGSNTWLSLLVVRHACCWIAICSFFFMRNNSVFNHYFAVDSGSFLLSV